MATGTDAALQRTSAPVWSYQTILDGQPIGELAREFARHHLAAHRLYHLLDIVGLVAGRLTGSDAFAYRGSVLTLSLSQTDAVVLVRLDDRSPAALDAQAPPIPAVEDESVGTGVYGLLTLQWGVSRVSDEAKGLWVSFDAHRHKQHADASMEEGILAAEGRHREHNGGGP
jgi:hypothetical protein